MIRRCLRHLGMVLLSIVLALAFGALMLVYSWIFIQETTG